MYIQTTHLTPHTQQTRILALNASYFLKNDGSFMISLKANCIDSTLDANVVIIDEMNKMKKEGLKRKERLTLEPFERDHAVVCALLLDIDFERFFRVT